MRRHLIILLTSLLLAAACTAGDDSGDGEATAGDGATAGAPTAEFPPDPRADGVTEDTIRLGITYVDLEALGDVVNIDHGDYEAAYTAVIDDINADGGVNGRQLEAAFAPVLPIGTEPADAACLELTEDQQVFAVLGFMIDEAPLCYVDLHDTPVIGGVITQERLDRAQAPWVSTIPRVESITARLVEAFANDGAFDDATVGVIALPADEALMSEVTVPALEDQGVTPADTAVIDAPPDDQVAALQQVGVIAERFEAAGIDTVVTVGNAALTTGQGLAQRDYRPRLLATGQDSLLAYVNAQEGFDPEVVEDALSGGYATDDDEPGMQGCLDVVEAATGITIPDSDDAEPGDPEPWVSAFNACQQLSLFRQIADAAGADLNNGTFGQAGYELGPIELPGVEGGATYGPDTLDGNQPVYLLRYDQAEGQLVQDEEPAA
jgi:ABC-type branched-subunit amino acid transport system substrate-binding protein